MGYAGSERDIQILVAYVVVVIAVVVVVVAGVVVGVVSVDFPFDAGVGALCRIMVNTISVLITSSGTLLSVDTCRGLVRGSTCLCFR